LRPEVDRASTSSWAAPDARRAPSHRNFAMPT
jgi:hypothetical protein